MDGGVIRIDEWPTTTCNYAKQRRFTIDDHPWLVCEDPDGEWGPALIFYGHSSARRVRDYPKNWLDLSDEQLYALSWNR